MSDEGKIPQVLPSLSRTTRALAKGIQKSDAKTPELTYVQGQVNAHAIVAIGTDNIYTIDVDIDGTLVYDITCLNCMPANGEAVWLMYLGAGRYLCIGSAQLRTGPAPYSVKAYRNAALNLAAAPAITLVQFDVEMYDPDNCFASGRYTCPFTGTYNVAGTAAISTNNSPDDLVFSVYDNAVEVARGSTYTVRGTAGDGWFMHINADVQATAGHLLDLRVFHSVGANVCAFQVGQVNTWGTFKFIPH